MSCKSSNQSFQCILLFRYPAKKLPLYFLFTAADSKDVLWKALWVILLHHISCYSSYTDKSNEFVAICDTRHTIIPIRDCEFQNNNKIPVIFEPRQVRNSLGTTTHSLHTAVYKQLMTRNFHALEIAFDSTAQDLMLRRLDTCQALSRTLPDACRDCSNM